MRWNTTYQRTRGSLMGKMKGSMAGRAGYPFAHHTVIVQAPVSIC